MAKSGERLGVRAALWETAAHYVAGDECKYEEKWSRYADDVSQKH